jgi:hypothetical protein
LLDQAAVTMVFLSAISYVVVGIYLLRKASTTRGRPEFYLGLAFLFDGFSYGFGDLPYEVDVGSLLGAFIYIGRISSGGCSFAIALFTWRVFQSGAAWARGLVWLIGALIVGGLAVSALEGDWEGLAPLSYRGFWLDWLGEVVPFLWLAFESSRQYLMTRRRVSLGLIDPLVCNRYLLIAVYATLGTITFLILVPTCIVYELYGTWSVALELATGIAEICALVALWMSFSAPAFYRHWLGGADAATSVEP